VKFSQALDALGLVCLYSADEDESFTSAHMIHL